MSGPTRDAAWKLLNEYTKSESLIKHMLAVEAAMVHYARKQGQDELLLGNTGLLHDFDYERWPNEDRDNTGHPFTGTPILREHGYPEELIDAILGHAPFSGQHRTTILAKTLFAVDELSGLIMALGYVRPNDLNELKPKSVRKKIKDKSFAAGASREDIRNGIDELGVDENEHIALVIKAMQSITKQLGFA